MPNGTGPMSDQPSEGSNGEVERVRVRLPGISSRAYEHPADRTALVAMRQITGFDTLLKKMSGLINDRSIRLDFLADAVKVSPEQFAWLDEIRHEAAAILDLEEVPELFVDQDPVPNAMTIGLDRPFIVVTTGLVELMDPEEMRFVVGHETGHALSGHAVYRTMLLWLTRLATNLAWLPVGAWGIRMIITALKEWFRKSELSCDRAGLLVEQDLDAGVRALMKIAGGAHLAEMNPVAFLNQGREYEATGDLRDSVLKLLNLKDRMHPYATLRALELTRWVEAGDYGRILGGDYPRREDDPRASVRQEAKSAADSYAKGFKQSTDPLMVKLREFAGDAAGVGDRIGERLYRMWGPRRGENGDHGDDDREE